MTASSTNRETVRDALATLLGTALVGTGLPAAEVVNYEKGVVTKTPLVMVLSGGSGRRQHGLNQEKWKNTFRLLVRVVVKDASADDSWTELNVEDRLDLIDKTIADVLADNRSTASWDYISYEENQLSIIGPVRDQPYMMEEFSVIVTVVD